MNNGYIAMHRRLLDWEWYGDINVCRLFIHCLLRANHKKNQWQGIEINAGQFVTSYEKLSQETRLTIKQVRVALNKLKRTGEVAHKGASRYSIITVNNWDKWQTEWQTKGQTEGKQRATNNNDNNDNKIINKNIPTKKQILDHLNLIGKTIDVDEFINYWNASDWLDKSGLPINWKQYLAWWKPKQSKSLKVVDAKKQKEEQEHIERMNKIAERFNLK